MSSVLFGRGHEMGLLREAWWSVVGGSGPRLVVLLGESGVGNTLMVKEFYAWLACVFRVGEGRRLSCLSLGTDRAVGSVRTRCQAAPVTVPRARGVQSPVFVNCIYSAL